MAAPPLTPTNVMATCVNGSISITWDTVVGATSYNLYRGTSSGGETLYVSGIAGSDGATSGYTDSNIGCTVTYYYKVSAVNIFGESPLSTEVSAACPCPSSSSSSSSSGGCCCGASSSSSSSTTPSAATIMMFGVDGEEPQLPGLYLTITIDDFASTLWPLTFEVLPNGIVRWGHENINFCGRCIGSFRADCIGSDWFLSWKWSNATGYEQCGFKDVKACSLSHPIYCEYTFQMEEVSEHCRLCTCTSGTITMTLTQ